MRSDLKDRTKRFALDVLWVAGQVPADSVGWPLRPQLIRAGTGVGSNYRAACRGKSRREFISKLTTAEEEADETAFWLEILVGCGSLPRDVAGPLLQEAGELTAIFVSSVKTARRNAT